MIRSLLYVPAHAERFIAKAHQRQADAIILDLEDAVPPEHKLAAREGLGASVPSVGQAGAQVFVRINAASIEDALAACRAGAVGLLVPKVERAADLERLGEALEPTERELGRSPMSLVAILEDPGAVLEARAIARAPRLLALATGGEDLALALGGQPTPDVLRLPKLLVHYAAKAQGLLSWGMLRSVADYTDHEGISAAAREAREHGFDGATCVHPGVVPLLNAGFAPSAEELAWAQRVVVAAEQESGAFALDGRMIDAPVIARARALLAVTKP
ncbi:aldolase/citrate lyase family protein [Devosia sp. 919]|uniref:aldolase/citrate lyase family protein n=1 Tax=Devosia sp. 919 TaxID=2726065 RepID=UPI0015532D44